MEATGLYLRLILIIFCLYSPATASSQDQVTDAQKLQEAMDALEEMGNAYSALLAQVQPEIDPKAQAALDAYNDSWVEYFSYLEDLRNHAMLKLWWQLLAAYCLTILVLGVAGLGIYLSIIEVRAALKKPREAGQDMLVRDMQGTMQEKIELTLSLQKLQVTSAVTGVVVLVLSLAFLYLFVKEVFEVNPQDFSAQAIPTTLPEEGQPDDAASSETPAG